MKELTEEQTKKFKELEKKFQKYIFWQGIKSFFTVIPATFAIAILNALYVQSSGFVFVSTVLTGLLVGRSLGTKMIRAAEKFEKDLTEVLKDS